jgi:hypothetical protein
MRIELDLDEDLAARAFAEAFRTGRPISEVLLSAARSSLPAVRRSGSREPFVVRTFDLELREGVDPDLRIDLR